MSNQAELHLLKQRVEELEETVEIIDRGMSKKERRLRDEFACAAIANGWPPQDCYRIADEALKERGE